MWPEGRLIHIRVHLQSGVDSFRYSERLEESRLISFVFRARRRWIGTEHDAAHCVGVVGRGEPALSHGGRHARKRAVRRIVGSTNQDDVSRRLDRRRKRLVGIERMFRILFVVRGEAVEDDVEQDHLRVKAREVIDHPGVIRVAERVRADVLL